MPDPNKLAKLRSMGFKILPCCGICAHARFRRDTDWGSCGLAGYRHEKHVAESKTASVHKAGSCQSFELANGKADDLERSGFGEFWPAAPDESVCQTASQ